MRPLDSFPFVRAALSATVLAALLAPDASAQDDPLHREGYLKPPSAIEDALMAPWQRNAELGVPSPDGRYFVVETRDRRMPPLSLLAKKHYHLGGLQVDPAADRQRDLTTKSPDGFLLISSEDGSTVTIRTPEGAKVSTPHWSPDGTRLAFFVHSPDATHIYVADAASGRARRVTPRPVLATLATDFDWSGAGGSIFTVLVPEDRGAEPEEAPVPPTPRVDLTSDGKNELRTFPDLLETPHERALVEYYGTGQLARIDVASGRARPIGEPALIDRVDASPDGRWVRVETIRKPFSKIVPVFDFARRDEIWNMDGDVVALVQEVPVDDGTDDDRGDDLRREVAWRPGGGLGFLEKEHRSARDDEDGRTSDARKDRVMRWLPPFDSASLSVAYETESSLDELRYSIDGETVFVLEENEDDETERLVAVAGDGVPHTVVSHDTEDAYDDPGTLVTLPGRPDAPVARISSAGQVYLRGTLYHEDPLEEAPQPFLDRVGITGGETERLFLSSPRRYEQVEAVLDDRAERLVIRRESPTEVPNYFVHDADGGAEIPLTQNQDYDPAFSGARREAVWATRADGVRFKVEIALPADYRDGQALPALFWHYPREYESEGDYHESLRDYNKNAFPRPYVRNMELLTRLGWAVVDPDVPIVGPRNSWNDLYVVDLRNSLSAAIDALEAKGWIDRSRLAIGGHSYGGFGTLNSMIQTPFFKAGIAGSANSNRTLTPAGFQRERRTLWEAREVYTRMSPLLYMNELSGALLLYHGLDDQNVGTFPEHSIRSFHALNALGKTAALYMYPYEEHGPDAQETIQDLWARWTAWLDKYVKNAAGEEGAAVAEESDSGGGALR